MRATRCRPITVALLLLASRGAHADKSGVRPNVISVPAGPGTIKGLGEQFEPSLNTALPAVQAEHGGLNENETHVPLLLVGGSTNGDPITPGIIRAPVTTTQIAPTILELLNLDPSALQAVRLENVGVLAGIKTDNGKSAH